MTKHANVDIDAQIPASRASFVERYENRGSIK
jgi:hypothetical protein